MNFLAPGRLWLLLVVAALAAGYLVMQLRRRHYAARFTNLDLLASVAPKRPGWRRHVAAAALLAAIVLLVAAWARPTRPERVPRERATVMLAIDTSTSMRATDVDPSRLEAAKAAASDFVGEMPDRFRLGLVAFNGNARQLVAPTQDHDSVRDALERLRLDNYTAIGEGIFTSLDGLQDVPSRTSRRRLAHVVLMSDGDTNSGRSNEDAADSAARRRIPVTTIAFGTDDGTIGSGTNEFSVPVNREALREIADTTSGRFYEAESADELQSVYSNIGSSVGFRTEQREATAWFVGIALAFVMVGTAASLIWTSRLP
jgi:Ca-activated chloride channel family protein